MKSRKEVLEEALQKAEATLQMLLDNSKTTFGMSPENVSLRYVVRDTIAAIKAALSY